MRPTMAVSFLVALACGGQSSGEQPTATAERTEGGGSAASVEREPDSAEVEPEPADPVGAEAAPPAEPPPPGTLAELFYFGFEAREYAEPMPSPREAVADCPPHRGQGPPGPEWFQECRLRSMLARTRRGWLALEIDWEESGVGELHLIEGDAAGQTERIGGDLTPRRLEALRSALNGTDAHALDDQIGRVVAMDFSLGTYHPLAELEDSEWLLWVETTQDLDDPEWVLWLVSQDGETKHEVARREAELGPCDGGGYWCERTQAPCDAAAMRAEGRLCVLPLGLRRVAIHGDEMALIGSVMIPGHGGMPQLTWFVGLPET
jgi:hypothetical protein